jgi:hypothetical protein
MSLDYLLLFIRLVWNSFFFWHKGCQFLIKGNLFAISYTNHRPHLFVPLKRRNSLREGAWNIRLRIEHMKSRSNPVSFHGHEGWYFPYPKNINLELNLKFMTNEIKKYLALSVASFAYTSIQAWKRFGDWYYLLHQVRKWNPLNWEH